LSQGMQIGAEMDLIRLTSFGTFPRGEGGICALHRRRRLKYKKAQ